MAAAALRLWGEPAQIDMMIEECAELVVALQHLKRGRIERSAVAAECVDVALMMDQARAVFADEWDAALTAKTTRLFVRLEEAEAKRWKASRHPVASDGEGESEAKPTEHKILKGTNMREKIARAIEDADSAFGYSASLTSLVDGVATYTLTIGGETLTFTDTDEASAVEQYQDHITSERNRRRADSIISLLPQWKGIESGGAAKRLEQAVEDCADDLEVIATANYEGADMIGWLRAFARASAESARRALPSPPGEDTGP